MKHINSAADLEPKSVGFANRGAESITIMGNVLSDILNGLGGAISDVMGQPHGSHLSIDRQPISFAEANQANPPPTPADLRRIRAVDATVPKTFTLGFTSDTSRLQDFIDERF